MKKMMMVAIAMLIALVTQAQDDTTAVNDTLVVDSFMVVEIPIDSLLMDTTLDSAAFRHLEDSIIKKYSRIDDFKWDEVVSDSFITVFEYGYVNKDMSSKKTVQEKIFTDKETTFPKPLTKRTNLIKQKDFHASSKVKVSDYLTVKKKEDDSFMQLYKPEELRAAFDEVDTLQNALLILQSYRLHEKLELKMHGQKFKEKGRYKRVGDDFYFVCYAYRASKMPGFSFVNKCHVKIDGDGELTKLSEQIIFKDERRGAGPPPKPKK